MLFALQAKLGSGYQSTFKQGRQSVTDLRDELRGLSGDGGSLGDTLSNAFTAVKGAIVASGVLAAFKVIGEAMQEIGEASIEFESAITGVAKTSNMSDKELATFAEEVKGLSTIIPVTTTELASIAETAGQLGIADEDLLEFTDIMAKLGTATTMTADNAATMLAQFANITQMSPDKYENLASTIVDLGNNFATTEQKITDMAQGIAAAGSLAGMSEAEMLGLSAAVSSIGIESQAGSTALSKLISEMSMAAETGENLDIFAKTAGMSADEFKKAWGEDATSVLTQFITGLNDTERNGKSATLVLQDLGITEARMLRMILSLANSGDLMSRAIETANQAWEENTALNVEAEKRYNTLQSRLTTLNNAWNNLKITVGDMFTPAIGDMVDEGKDFLVWLNDVLKGEATLQDRIEKVTRAYEKETDMVGASASVAFDYIARLEELEKQGLKTKDAQDEYRDILEKLVTLVPSLREQIDLENGSLLTSTDALRENTREWMRNAVYKAYEEQFSAKIQAVADAEAKLTAAQSKLNKAQGEFDRLMKRSGADKLAAALGTTVEGLRTYDVSGWGPAYQQLLEGGYDTSMIDQYQKYSTEIYNNLEAQRKAKEEIDSLKKQLEEAKDAVDDVRLSMQELDKVIDNLVKEYGATPDRGGAADPALALAMASQNRINRLTGRGADTALAGVPGHASGLDYVPHDNYVARLHRGERVLTAAEAREYRSGDTGVSIQYSPTIYAYGADNLERQLIKHTRVIEQIVDDRLREHEAEAQRRVY